MKDAADSIRTWLYGVLNNAVTYNSVAVPVYSFAPKDAALPYILLAGQSSGPENDESTKDSWITRHQIAIEIYSEHTGNDATYKAVNSISNSILLLIRTRTAATMSGYTVVSRVIDSTITDMMDFDTKIIAVKIINLSLIIEEV